MIVYNVVKHTSAAVVYGGTATAGVLGYLNFSNVGVMLSVLIAAIGLATNIWATWRRDRREAERHRVEMERGLAQTAPNRSRYPGPPWGAD